MTESDRADEQLPGIARFEVRRRAYLAPGGSINRRLPAFASARVGPIEVREDSPHISPY